MLWWFAETTLVAAGLACLATLACRSRRLGPEARHALWLVVMIKLAMPPVVAWPRISPAVRPADPLPIPPGISPVVEFPPIPDLPTDPQLEPGEPESPPAPPSGRAIPGLPDSGRAAPEPEDRPTRVMSPEIEPGFAEPKSGLRISPSGIPPILLGLWLAGSIAVVARRAIGVARFRRSLRGAGPAPARLVEEARAIGERIGVRPPPILVAPGVATPLLWCLGRPRLYLPGTLVDRLDVDRWSGVLAHELAHLARRDHWVVRLELLVEAAWWWNPLFHLARRRLRAEAEQAADARVIRALPDRRFAYAEALVEICEHLARSAVPSPALGVGGAEASRTLEGRLLMILRDPIPRPPGRRVVLAAGLLAAVALPTWTLGQQPEPPKPTPTEAPPVTEASPKPIAPADEPARSAPTEAPQPANPSAPVPTIDEIRAGFVRRRKAAVPLGFRYSVASRGRSNTGMGGDREFVRVQVADVLLGADAATRLDVLSHFFNFEPGGPRPIPWLRRFVARDRSSLVTFQSLSTKAGPVPFRWQAGGGRVSTVGDDLALELVAGTGQRSFDEGQAIDPLVPRPRNVLDLDGATAYLLDPGGPTAQVEVAGADVVEGREVVRVAWVSRRNDGQGGAGLRGLLWLAPSMGFAVVRSEAAQDASRVGITNGRRTWRKTASDFVEVGGLWLPRKVEARNFSDGFGSSPMGVHEPTAFLATFEDYRVHPELPADAFHPRFPIETLDDQTGDFTTKPPEPPPGLVERFRRAVDESPFGPPGFREITGGPGDGPGGLRGFLPGLVQDGDQELMRTNPQFQAAFQKYARLVRGTNDPNAPEAQEAKRSLDEMRARLKAAAKPDAQPPDSVPPRLAPDVSRPDGARPDPAVVPGPRPTDPAPAAEPPKADPAPADLPPDERLLVQQIERRFKDDPEVIALVSSMREAGDRRDQVAKTATPGDPAERKAREAFLKLQNMYERLRELKSRQIREQLTQSNEGNGELALLQSRRDGKAAEVRKAEAARDLAKVAVDRNIGLLKKGQNYVSQEEVSRAEGGLRVAEAEVAIRKADLAGADIGLDQARRRLGFTPGPEAATSAASGATLADLRDAAEVMEVQLRGKQAELRGEDLKVSRAQTNVADMKKAGMELQDSFRDAKVDVEAAQAELDRKKAEVVEFEVRLRQAKRRVEAEEARLKRAVPQAKARLDWAEAVRKKGYVAASEVEAARSRYEELMFQLDPKYAPTPAPPAGPAENPR